jgi:hypothetical protein
MYDAGCDRGYIPGSGRSGSSGSTAVVMTPGVYPCPARPMITPVDADVEHFGLDLFGDAPGCPSPKTRAHWGFDPP